jgi:hypothetical protein
MHSLTVVITELCVVKTLFCKLSNGHDNGVNPQSELLTLWHPDRQCSADHCLGLSAY